MPQSVRLRHCNILYAINALAGIPVLFRLVDDPEKTF